MGAADLKLARSGGSGPRPGTRERARGLSLARRIDRTRALIQQARRRVKRSDAKGRKKARAALATLREVLQGMEQDALSRGVSVSYKEDAVRLLGEAEEQLDRVVSRKKALKKRHLRHLRREITDVARRLEAMMATDPTTDEVPRTALREASAASDGPVADAEAKDAAASAENASDGATPSGTSRPDAASQP